MSTQIEYLMRTLRALPYEDMINVAKALASKLGDGRADATMRIADALATLPKAHIDESALHAAENKALREMLGRSRGFDIKVRALPKGWSVSCDGFRSAGVQSPELRDAITQLLDQEITTQIMMK